VDHQPYNMVVPQEHLQAVAKLVVPRVIQHIQERGRKKSKAPFIMCLSGLQGSGKSTWAGLLAAILKYEYAFKVVSFSLDDLYPNHEGLVKIRNDNLGNSLLRMRGQPGTHDEILALRIFDLLKSGSDFKVPVFDKSKFNGEGDRVPEEEWEVVLADPPIDIVIFDGWCVGFQSLSEEELIEKWRAAKEERPAEDENERKGFTTKMLRKTPFDHVKVINSNLLRYNKTFLNPRMFNYFIHLDTAKIVNVYRWRLDQEHKRWETRGIGMTDEEVIRFVQGYMPSYELYLERLQRKAFIPPNRGPNTQLRVVLDENRTVLKIEDLT
jgi:D-glycerate 3-kinase